MPRRYPGLPSTHAPRLCALAAALLALGGCPDDTATPTDTSGDAPPGGRPFLMAARAEAYDPDHRPPQVASLESLTIPEGDDATRPVEAIVVPLDLLGIPWTAFVGNENTPTELPGPWVTAVDALVTLAGSTGLPVVLAVSPLSPRFDTLAPMAKDGAGLLVLDDAWKEYCYDPSKDATPTRHRDPFAGFVTWAVDRFQPRAVILGQRMNLYEASCGQSAYEAMLGYVGEAARRLRERASPPEVYVTLDVEDLYGYPQKPGRCVSGTPQDCLAGRADLLTAAADALGAGGIIGLESYPARALADLDDLPADWLRRVADLVPSGLRSAIAGTGLPAIRLETPAGVCTPLLEATEVDQKLWLDQVLAVAELKDMPLVVWRGLRDLAPADVVGACPCSGDFALCEHLAGLGAGTDDRRLELVRGLWDVDGVPRQGATLWTSVLEGD